MPPLPMRAVFVHGWASGPTREWWPWLLTALEAHGWEVVAPQLPNPRIPIIEPWVDALAAAAGIVDERTVFVGHSVGCQTILRTIEAHHAMRPAGAVFVAGWRTLAGLESDEERMIARPWIETPIDIPHVRERLLRSIALFSTNDPYVPMENVAAFEAIGATTLLLGARGHVSAQDGVRELPEALEAVLSFEDR